MHFGESRCLRRGKPDRSLRKKRTERKARNAFPFSSRSFPSFFLFPIFLIGNLPEQRPKETAAALPGGGGSAESAYSAYREKKKTKRTSINAERFARAGNRSCLHTEEGVVFSTADAGNKVHSIGEGIRLHGFRTGRNVRRRIFCPEQNKRAASGGLSSLEIRKIVADHNGGGKINFILLRRLQNQTGSGFPAGTGNRIDRNFSAGIMWTVIPCVDLSALPAEDFVDSFLNALQVLETEVSPGDSGLVGNSDDLIPAAAHPAERSGRAGKQLHLSGVRKIMFVQDKDSVPIQEKSLVHHNEAEKSFPFFLSPAFFIQHSVRYTPIQEKKLRAEEKRAILMYRQDNQGSTYSPQGERNRTGKMKDWRQINIRDFGAVGDGAADDSGAIQKALDGEKRIIRIPEGRYRIVRTLRVRSHTYIDAAPGARLFLCSETPKQRGDFLLTNADHETGNEDIRITGGIWDGNNSGRFNTKDPDLFRNDAWSGATLNFFHVRALHLENMELANSVVYNIRMARLNDFLIRGIRFSSEKPAFNQDGLHFGGCVRNGIVENIRVLSKGQTNDDLIALNADDSMERLENQDLCCGPIENLIIRNVFAEDCYSVIRMLSVSSPIRNILFENIEAGCRHFAVNLDAARYCRTPLFREEDFPEGCGAVENILIRGFRTRLSADRPLQLALIQCETRVKNFLIRDFERSTSLEQISGVPTFLARNVPGLRISASFPSAAEPPSESSSFAASMLPGGKEPALTEDFSAFLKEKSDSCEIAFPFSTLKLDC